MRRLFHVCKLWEKKLVTLLPFVQKIVIYGDRKTKDLSMLFCQNFIQYCVTHKAIQLWISYLNSVYDSKLLVKKFLIHDLLWLFGGKYSTDF